jgi:hypothetical protein
MRRGRRIFLMQLERQHPVPGHPSDWRRSKPMEDRGQGRLRVRVPRNLTVTGCPAVADGP